MYYEISTVYVLVYDMSLFKIVVVICLLFISVEQDHKDII